MKTNRQIDTHAIEAKIRSLNLRDGYALYKYCNHKDWDDAIKGTKPIRICPASEYLKPEYNQAIQDDERNRINEVQPTSIEIKGNTSDQAIRLNSILKTTLTFSAQKDYFIFCCAAAFRRSALEDFGCDSCLVIENPEAFIDRLIAAFACVTEGVQPGARLVEYFDSRSNDPEIWRRLEGIDHVFMKDRSRYKDQSEFRVVWIPNDMRREPLKFVEVRPGNLQDICVLVGEN